MKEFYITSTITIMAENRKEADEILRKEQEERQTDITDSLIKNAEIDEA